jgi:L-2-hydroxyglutarate oxidase LhgO
MFDVDCVIAGAGVIGLAIAREMAQAGYSVLVAEAAGMIGSVTSSRNSEVIHAGIYYPKDSLKARLCVRGKAMLYAYCAQRNVPARRMGKLIVATSQVQLPALQNIRAHALANGVDDLMILSALDAQALEPELCCLGALLSPSTGILDAHAYMLSLQADAEAAGAQLVFHSPVVGARSQETGGFVVDVGGTEPVSVSSRMLVNAAGLHAPVLARAIRGMPDDRLPGAWYCKGTYASLAGRAPFSRLVYPVPEEAGLGVHLTLDMAGQARFGPDVEWVEKEDYSLDPARLAGFEDAVRAYWPGLPENALAPTYAGIRPKISGPGAPAADFLLSDGRQFGMPGLMNLFGIESPGLTASLAIAERVRQALQAQAR